MRIAFVGKGGSGKTTVASLFARFLAAQGKPVLAIDADINQHFGAALGFPEDKLATLRTVSQQLPAVREYLAGNNPRIKPDGTFRPSTPPGTGSVLIYDWKTDPMIALLSRDHAGITFLRMGDMETQDVGQACYHGKLMGGEVLLNHVIDGKDDYVVVDMTAGADAFGSGLFLKFDLIVLVVEPTEKSLDVFTQFKELSAEYPVRLLALGNKVMDAQDEAFLRERLGDALLGFLPYHRELRAVEQGLQVSTEAVMAPFQPTLAALQERLDACGKNWQQFYQHLVQHHRTLAKSWLNASYGISFEDQIDPSFSGEKMQQPVR